MNGIWQIMFTFVRESDGNPIADIASEALCFFQTENFDNSHEKMEKPGRSSLGVDSIGRCPLSSYKGVSCSSNLFSGSRRPLCGLVERLTLPFVVAQERPIINCK